MSLTNHHHHTTDNIRTAFLLNLFFTLVELVGGILTNSVAVLSDAIHDLGDSTALGLAWYLNNLSYKERDSRYSYGYKRFSLLGALVSTLILITGSVFILTKSIPRIFNPEPTNATGMLIFAILGVGVNGLAALRLRRDHSLNARMVAFHLIEDILGWAAVLIVSLVLLFRPFYILDAILSITITVFILFNVIRNLKKILSLFLQAIPDQIDVEEIERHFTRIPKVLSCHHTHCWSLDGEHHVLTTHVVLDVDTTRDEVFKIKKQIQTLAKSLDFTHITVETEFAESDCTMTHETAT